MHQVAALSENVEMVEMVECGDTSGHGQCQIVSTDPGFLLAMSAPPAIPRLATASETTASQSVAPSLPPPRRFS